MVLRIATKEYFESLFRFQKHLPPGEDEVLLVLKGHLLVERLLETYLERNLKDPSQLLGAGLSFSQRLSLVAAAYDGPVESEWLWEAARALNKIRNELVHQLETTKYEALRNLFIRFALSSPEVPDLEPPESVSVQLHRAIFIVHEALSHRLDL